MVLYSRSRSDDHIGTNKSSKYLLPYGNALMHRKKCNKLEGSNVQRAQSLTSLESQLRNSVPNVKSRLKSLKLRSTPATLMYGILLAAVSYYVYLLRTELTQRDNELRTIRHDFDIVEDALLTNEAKIQAKYNSSEIIRKQLESLLPVEQRSGLEKGEELYTKVVERQRAIVHRINYLQNNIADLDRKEILEHYGPGSHKVQFDILENDEIVSFIVELAGLELMPHSVHYFIEMVERKVWDNTIFQHKSNHLLYAQLMDAEGNDKHHLLSEKDIPSRLSFPEYTDRYPHHKYTLGFSGRPGGPEFYINTDNNADIHGPGGQMSHDLHEEADPCFGTVIEGHQVIDRLYERTQMADRKSVV